MSQVLSQLTCGSINLIYTTTKIPDQWLIAITIPIHKKGHQKDIKVNLPIAKLSSTFKVFEKLILSRILEDYPCSFVTGLIMIMIIILTCGKYWPKKVNQ